MTQARSIHYQRRWFYVLWCGLLLASLTALGLWELPTQTGTADLLLKVRATNAPAGCVVQFWAGPKGSWPSADQAFLVNQAGRPLTGEGEADGFFRLRVAYRRWAGGYIPRRTDDLLILKFLPKTGAPRYFSLSLERDWYSRLLRPGKRMQVACSIAWDGLWLDATSVPKTSE